MWHSMNAVTVYSRDAACGLLIRVLENADSMRGMRLLLPVECAAI
jgi:hypothetical protein